MYVSIAREKSYIYRSPLYKVGLQLHPLHRFGIQHTSLKVSSTQATRRRAESIFTHVNSQSTIIASTVDEWIKHYSIHLALRTSSFTDERKCTDQDAHTPMRLPLHASNVFIHRRTKVY